MKAAPELSNAKQARDSETKIPKAILKAPLQATLEAAPQLHVKKPRAKDSAKPLELATVSAALFQYGQSQSIQ